MGNVLTDNYLLVVGEIERLINNDKQSTEKANSRKGLDYYLGEHDIKQYRIFYIDGNGVLKEDKFASNYKLKHQFLTELIDQKVQYLLSNPVEITTEQEGLEDYLQEYINEEFQEVLQEALEGASQKAKEYVYAYKNIDNKLIFAVADSLGVIPFKDSNGDLEGIIRYYERVEKDTFNKDMVVLYVERWTKEGTLYLRKLPEGSLELDPSKEINPRPHVLLTNGEEKAGKNFDYLPFFELVNNKHMKTDLEPIKELIDDYDLMASSLSNNLQDFQEAIYVVRGYNGDDLDTLKTNLKTKKTVGVDAEGGIEVKTIDIPFEARKQKLALDKEGIYKFGMGFDSSQTGDGNITNVVIKSRYSLLDLKCNKAEIRLRKLIRNLLKAIILDINERYNKTYNADELIITIERDTTVNEQELYTNDKIQAETINQQIANVLLAGNSISQESILRLLCDALGLDFEEEQQLLGNEGPYSIEATIPDLINKAGGIVE